VIQLASLLFAVGILLIIDAILADLDLFQ